MKDFAWSRPRANCFLHSIVKFRGSYLPYNFFRCSTHRNRREYLLWNYGTWSLSSSSQKSWCPDPKKEFAWRFCCSKSPIAAPRIWFLIVTTVIHYFQCQFSSLKWIFVFISVKVSLIKTENPDFFRYWVIHLIFSGFCYVMTTAVDPRSQSPIKTPKISPSSSIS